MHVTNILVVENDEFVIKNLKKYLHFTFHLKDLGSPKYFSSNEIAKFRRKFDSMNANISPKHIKSSIFKMQINFHSNLVKHQVDNV